MMFYVMIFGTTFRRIFQLDSHMCNPKLTGRYIPKPLLHGIRICHHRNIGGDMSTQSIVSSGD